MADQTIWDEPTQDQLLLLRGIHSHWANQNSWPDVRYLIRWLRQSSVVTPVREIMKSFPVVGSRRGVGPSYSAIWFNPSDYGNGATVRLTLAAGLVLSEFTRSTDVYIPMIQLSAQRVANASPSAGPVRLKSNSPLSHIGDQFAVFVETFPDIIEYEPLNLATRTIKPKDDIWAMELVEVLAEYANVSNLKDYVGKTLEIMERETPRYQRSDTVHTPVAPVTTSGTYVSPALIDELAGLEQQEWNVQKLLALLGELNSNYADGHPYASLMLYRAVIDCVPPVFACKSFTQVVSSAPGIGATNSHT